MVVSLMVIQPLVEFVKKHHQVNKSKFFVQNSPYRRVHETNSQRPWRMDGWKNTFPFSDGPISEVYCEKITNIAHIPPKFSPFRVLP